MNIIALVTKNNQIIIDPDIEVNLLDINSINIQFVFQQAWDTTLLLRAIFKPDNDISYAKFLNNSFSATIPQEVLYNCKKLGIGLVGSIFDSTKFTVEEYKELITGNVDYKLMELIFENTSQELQSAYETIVKNTNYFWIPTRKGAY